MATGTEPFFASRSRAGAARAPVRRRPGGRGAGRSRRARIGVRQIGHAGRERVGRDAQRGDLHRRVRQRRARVSAAGDHRRRPAASETSRRRSAMTDRRATVALRASAGAAAPAPGGSIASGSARRERDQAVHRMTPAKCARLIAIRARVRRALGAAQRRTRRAKADRQPGFSLRTARTVIVGIVRTLGTILAVFIVSLPVPAAAQNCGCSRIDHRVSYDASGMWNPCVYRGIVGG